LNDLASDLRISGACRLAAKGKGRLLVLSRTPLSLERPERLKLRDIIKYCKRQGASQ
jgi:hypothetical protein